jgi:hypothetical protein
MSQYMSRSSALTALALLLAVTAITAGAASTGATDSPPFDSTSPTVDGSPADVTVISNATNYLSVGTPDRQTYVRSDADVTAAAGMSVERLRGNYADRVFDREFQSAGGDRLTPVRDRVDAAEDRLDRLDARYDTLLDVYSNGSLSRETFLRRVARLSAQTSSVEGTLEHVSTRVDESPGTSLPIRLSTRISDLQTEQITLPDPVRERVRAGLSGRDDPAVVYVGGTTDSLVLATVDGEELTRTATVRDAYAPDQPDQFEEAEGRSVVLALQRGGELYPWAYDNAIGTPQVRGFGNTAVYLVRVEHPQGNLETYLSGGTRDAFHEIQTLRAGQIPVTATTTSPTDSLNVTVATTSPTGPMRVSLVQPSTGAPLEGTVRVNGEAVGRTGDDGELYTVQPAGQFQVNATTGANSAELTVS